MEAKKASIEANNPKEEGLKIVIAEGRQARSIFWDHYSAKDWETKSISGLEMTGAAGPLFLKRKMIPL